MPGSTCLREAAPAEAGEMLQLQSSNQKSGGMRCCLYENVGWAVPTISF
jgi:hypothetical protein